ncbi:MAG TPA: glycosyltransferase family 4 protein [Candidatus Olsenella pullistercoris]|uniref:Glycosyltransferase family 4 protein n=1 Tax=Candidatus Olsenella pullistercoris TaxID=2838712 RepID=A0A9D2EXE1_9ACTN|nr:glycosyltransferase family 4 protein [Candidatus Olsenella pullistercoris]
MEGCSYALFSAQYPPHMGGIESFTQGLASALVERGNDVLVVTNDTDGVGSGIVRERGVDVARLPCRPLIGGRLPLALHNASCSEVLSEVSKRKLDGVLVNARFYPHSLLGMRVAREHGLSPVVLDHGSAYLTFGNPVLDVGVRMWEHVITMMGKSYGPRYYGISEKSVDWLRAFGIRACGVIPNAIDAASYRGSASSRDFRGELGVAGSAPLVVFVGRLIPEKGVRSIIEASRDKSLAAFGVTFVLAGDGPLAGEVRAAEGGALRWVGRLSREDTAALLLQANLLCLPSRSEGFSTTLLEAASCACPALVTDVGGARELIPDGSYGKIMADASSRSIVRDIVALLERRENLAAMGRRGQRLVSELFSWDNTARAIEQACL